MKPADRQSEPADLGIRGHLSSWVRSEKVTIDYIVDAKLIKYVDVLNICTHL